MLEIDVGNKKKDVIVQYFGNDPERVNRLIKGCMVKQTWIPDE